MAWHLVFTTSVTRIRLRASARRPSWPLGDVARALVGGFEQAAISGSYSKASALRFQFRRCRLCGQKMQAWAWDGECTSVVTVFCSMRHSIVRARDLEERGEIFVGGDEQAMVVHKLAVFGLVACRVSIGMHLPNLFCEFRQGIRHNIAQFCQAGIWAAANIAAQRRTGEYVRSRNAAKRVGTQRRYVDRRVASKVLSRRPKRHPDETLILRDA
jgi:hypothetical protein